MEFNKEQFFEAIWYKESQCSLHPKNNENKIGPFQINEEYYIESGLKEGNFQNVSNLEFARICVDMYLKKNSG